MNNKVLHNNQKPVSERQIPTHINTIREKEVKKAAEIKNITSSGQTIVENTSENSAVEPEKHCVQLDSSKVTSYNNENNHKTAIRPRMSGLLTVRGGEDGSKNFLTKLSKNNDKNSGAEPQSFKQQNNISQKEQRWAFEILKTHKTNLKNLPQSLQFAVDQNSNVVFLIDSGSEISLLPQSLTNGINRYFCPNTKSIQGIGDTVIHSIGSVDIEIKLGNLGPITHNFWITQVYRGHGIIGLDFLIANNLVISPAKSELRSASSESTAKLFFATQLPIPIECPTNKVQLPDLSHLSLKEKCTTLLKSFPEITKKTNYKTSPKHNHLLEIIVDNYTPKMIKARMCGGQRTEIEKHFNDLLERGVVIRGSADVCASPITCVQTKEKSLRVCID